MTENLTQASAPTRNPVAAFQPEVPQVLHISTPTVVQALSNAFATSRYSLCLELSAGISLFMSSGGVSPDAKSELQSLYVQAGHLAATPDSPEYKSTRRKIGLTALLFQFIGQERLQEVVGGAVELQAITSLASHIEAMGVRTYESVAVMTGRARAMPKAVSAPTEVKEPSAEAREHAEKIVSKTTETEAHKAEETALEEHIAQEQSRVADYIRAVHEGKEDVVTDFRITPEEEMTGPWHAELSPRPNYPEWISREETQHITLTSVNIDIAVSASKDDLLKAAYALMELASTMDGPEPPQEVITKEPGTTAHELAVGTIPSSLRKVVEDNLKPVPEGASTPLRAALEAALQALPPEEVVETDEEIAEHQRKESEALEAKQKADKVANAPSRYRKGTTKPPVVKS